MRSVAIPLVALVVGCAHRELRREPSVTSSPDVCRTSLPFCLPALDMELLLREAPLDIRAAEPIGAGLTGARRLLVDLPSGTVVRLKWKTSALGGDGHNRSPRRELAAYALQRPLLSEADYVVPPTVARCLPERTFRRQIDAEGAPPTFDGDDCVLGILAYWIEDATQLVGYSQARFAADPTYRRRIALLNVITHLMDHRDTKPENFLVLRGSDPRAFSIDNGLAFSGWRTPRGWFWHEWQDLLVDSLPSDLVARLRSVGRAELTETLGTVAQFRVRAGRLEPMPLEPPFDANEGVRRRDDAIQLGLTSTEIDGVAARLSTLLDRVDSGAVKVF